MSGHSSFLFGTSASNQKKETWRAIFKKERSAWWINFFTDQDSAMFFPNLNYHKECLR